MPCFHTGPLLTVTDVACNVEQMVKIRAHVAGHVHEQPHNRWSMGVHTRSEYFKDVVACKLEQDKHDASVRDQIFVGLPKLTRPAHHLTARRYLVADVLWQPVLVSLGWSSITPALGTGHPLVPEVLHQPIHEQMAQSKLKKVGVPVRMHFDWGLNLASTKMRTAWMAKQTGKAVAKLVAT